MRPLCGKVITAGGKGDFQRLFCPPCLCAPSRLLNTVLRGCFDAPASMRLSKLISQEGESAIGGQARRFLLAFALCRLSTDGAQGGGLAPFVHWLCAALRSRDYLVVSHSFPGLLCKVLRAEPKCLILLPFSGVVFPLRGLTGFRVLLTDY